MTNKSTGRFSRKKRIRSRIFGTSERPRLSVFRSLGNIYVQAIDDSIGKTLAEADIRKLGKKTEKNTIENAKEVGKMIAKKCLKLKIAEAVFDRSGYKYHGKVKALAEGAREEGLKF